jgi:hypothetical protein
LSCFYFYFYFFFSSVKMASSASSKRAISGDAKATGGKQRTSKIARTTTQLPQFSSVSNCGFELFQMSALISPSIEGDARFTIAWYLRRYFDTAGAVIVIPANWKFCKHDDDNVTDTEELRLTSFSEVIDLLAKHKKFITNTGRKTDYLRSYVVQRFFTLHQPLPYKQCLEEINAKHFLGNLNADALPTFGSALNLESVQRDLIENHTSRLYTAYPLLTAPHESAIDLCTKTDVTLDQLWARGTYATHLAVTVVDFLLFSAQKILAMQVRGSVGVEIKPKTTDWESWVPEYLSSKSLPKTCPTKSDLQHAGM